jgi:hypothetical protein
VPVKPGSSFVRAGSGAWRDCLQHLRHEAYHLPEYAALDARLVGGAPVAFRFGDGEDELLLPLILRRVPGTDHLDATSPYGYPGPVASTLAEPFWKDAFHALVDGLAELGAVSCFVRLSPLLPAVRQALEGVGSVVEHGQTVSIDLRPAPEDIFASFRTNHRRQITRSRANGRRLVVDDWSYLPAFVETYHETMRRVGAADYYFFSYEHFARMRDELTEAVHLMTILGDGELLAGGVFLEGGGIVQYHLGATRTAALREQPTKLMFDETARWARVRGNVDLHLGAGVGGENNPLFHFKAGFSPLRRPFHTLRIVVDEGAYRRLSDRGGSGPVTGDGPTSYFPAYRSPAGDRTQPPTFAPGRGTS